MVEEKAVKEELVRLDGYSNMMTKFGTKKDNSTQYKFDVEPIATDRELTVMYEGNGLFTKIIDRPAEEAVKHGFDFEDFGDAKELFEKKLEYLDFEEKIGQALKWSRLYGGAIIVMIVDDGCDSLEEPLNWRRVKSIEELYVFERSIVSTSPYQYGGFGEVKRDLPFGQPEFYEVSSIYGHFRVHYTRCMIFKNGKCPELTTNQLYRDWGMPELVKIRKALQETITSHSDGVKMLERSVQAIYKMKNLANLLSTDQGEDKVIQRLEVIDMARSFLNSLAIDTEGEDYTYITAQLSGFGEVTNAVSNMLSAVTDIPQTILFGSSPAGMNATGESDLENYYNMVERIQKTNLKKNARILFDIISIELKKEGKIDKEQDEFPVKFQKLWSMSEKEQADLDQVKANTEQARANTANIYVTMQALDPSEVRKKLSESGEYDVEGILEEGEEEWPEDAFNPNPKDAQAQNPMGNPATPMEKSANGAENVPEEPNVNGTPSPMNDKKPLEESNPISQ